VNTNNAYAGCSNRISIIVGTLLLSSLAVVAIWQRGVAADARPFLETGLPTFPNDNAARRHYRLPSLLVTGKGTVIAVSQLRRGPDDFAP
jgi:hypothetical protein